MQGDLGSSIVSPCCERLGKLACLGGEPQLIPPDDGVFCGHKYTAIAHSTWGTSEYTRAAPPSRVVRTEEPAKHVLAERGAFHDFKVSSCTSVKKKWNSVAQCHAPITGTNHSAARVQDRVAETTQARCSWLPQTANHA